jgi:hypothetical protein
LTSYMKIEMPVGRTSEQCPFCPPGRRLGPTNQRPNLCDRTYPPKIGMFPRNILHTTVVEILI